MIPFSFLTPAFLAAAAAAALPLVLHLLRRHPEVRVRFAAVRLLKDAPVEQRRRRRLRELLLLALRVAALVLLAFAFARPYLPGAAGAGAAPITIVGVDVSASMSAPGQFAHAQALAREAVRNAPGDARVGLETFADRADLIVEPTRDRAIVLGAIARLQAGVGATSYRAALARAAGAIGAGRGAIVLVTDLQRTGWDGGGAAALPEGVRVTLADTGTPTGNVAVVDLRREEGGVVATLRNAGAAAASGGARLTIDGRQAGVQTWSVPAGGTADVAFAAAVPASGAAAVTIDDRTGATADNTRYLALDPPAPVPVLVIAAGDDALYVQQALDAGGADARFAVTTVKPAVVATMGAAGLAPYRAAILLDTQGLDVRGREALAALVDRGRGLLVAAGPGIDAGVLQSIVPKGMPAMDVTPPQTDGPGLSLVVADVRHPVVASFGPSAVSLGAVRFRRVARVAAPPSAEVVAQFSDGEPALVDLAGPSAHVLLFASDLSDRWNDFPRHPTFLPFLQEAVGYLVGPRRLPGGYLVGEVPPGVAARPGVVTVPAADGQPARRVAVNVDPREADLARISPADFQSAIVRLEDAGAVEARAAAAADENRQHVWWYALVLVLVVLVGESAVARRTT
ncbi:MAG: VWA domain-containing protein [Acidobacteriota bacterium]|nr:VWA domain-containing protein [Acidobacteriota bacterium]